MGTRLRLAALALLLAGAPARAQEMSESDYRKMMEQVMKTSGSQAQAEAQSWDARLKVVSGSVLVKTVEKDEWSAITGEIPLEPNDLVKTAADGLAEIYLDDKGAIALGRNTELEITSLEQEDTVLSLSFGSLAAKIRHFLNAKHKFQVRTPSAVCAVRGTEFAAEYSLLGKESAFAVFDEGRLGVSQGSGASGQAPQEYLLEKNTEVVFNPAQKRVRPGAISRMGRHRGAILNTRKRLETLKGWKPRTAARRAELRDRALNRRVIRKELDRGAKPPAVKKRAPVKKTRRTAR
jgi:hypothetical protein